MNRTILLLLFVLFSAGSLSAQGTTGEWLMYFGSFRFTERLSLHNEVQFRSYTLAPNMEQLLTRIGAKYHFKNGMTATLGYGNITSWPQVKGNPDFISYEHRIWQEFIMKNKLQRLNFMHRYRIEQRWVSLAGNTNYSNRVRYMLALNIPLNTKEMEKGTFYLSFYNEFFLDVDVWGFGQNRLYGALGYRICDPLAVQAGYLYQRVSGINNHRLQLGFAYNPDFRK